LGLHLNEVKEGEDLNESGIEFQMAGTAQRKARATKLLLAEGSWRSRLSAKLSPE